jgi:branched-chain amino acid transport system ATP-binding protein
VTAPPTDATIAPVTTAEPFAQPQPAPDRPVVLSGRGLCMRFGGFTAIEDVDLDVREGDIHALVGPNGAGKSTLLNLLGGQLLQTSGEIRFLDRSLGTTTSHARARLGIGRSFQLTSVVPGFSCLENVVLAVEARHRSVRMLRPTTRPRDVEQAQELLSLVGLGGQAELPVEALGHGRQKQLEVAIALGGRPRVLLLDEPSSGLSEHERGTLERLLQRVVGQSTIVMAEHDVELVRRIATRVTAFSLGRKVAEGTAEEVFSTPEVRQVFLRAETGGV